jgi:hypothetical protein
MKAGDKESADEILRLYCACTQIAVVELIRYASNANKSGLALEYYSRLQKEYPQISKFTSFRIPDKTMQAFMSCLISNKQFEEATEVFDT